MNDARHLWTRCAAIWMAGALTACAGVLALLLTCLCSGDDCRPGIVDAPELQTVSCCDTDSGGATAPGLCHLTSTCGECAHLDLAELDPSTAPTLRAVPPSGSLVLRFPVPETFPSFPPAVLALAPGGPPAERHEILRI